MITTSVRYLARDKLYETEKPYSADFEVDEYDNAQRTNYILTQQPVIIHPIRNFAEFTLDKNGFCVVDAQIQLDTETALANPEAVEAAYLDTVRALLRKKFPEYSKIEPMEFVVRKRDERFPSDTVAVVTHEQPACLAHSDYSVDGAKLQLRASFPGQESYFEGQEYDMINVWRPLVGPNNDWPLAVCDYTSVDIKRDVIVADLLHTSRICENQLLHSSSRHKWYYVEDQLPNHILIFRNVDSTGKRAKSFHCAFFNPNSRNPPRQSCEARFVAFR